MMLIWLACPNHYKNHLYIYIWKIHGPQNKKAMGRQSENVNKLDNKEMSNGIQPINLIVMSPYGTSCIISYRPAAAPAETEQTSLYGSRTSFTKPATSLQCLSVCRKSIKITSTSNSAIAERLHCRVVLRQRTLFIFGSLESL